MQAVRLISTKEMPREEWLQWRKKGIGGSDVAAICGLSRYKSAVQVYLDKLGQLPESEDNPKMKAGRMLEPVIAAWFAEETGMRVMQQHSIFQHKEHPFMLANIDRWIVGQNAGLEIKNTGEYSRGDWEGESIPTEYLLQANHYMAVLGAERWYVAVLIGGWDFQWRVIERDDRLIQNLITIESNFWHEHVLKKVPPAFSSKDTETLNFLYPESQPLTTMDISESYYDLIKRYFDTKKALQIAEDNHEEVKNQIKGMMGNTELAFWQGEKMFSWKTNAKGSRVFKTLGGI